MSSTTYVIANSLPSTSSTSVKEISFLPLTDSCKSSLVKNVKFLPESDAERTAPRLIFTASYKARLDTVTFILTLDEVYEFAVYPSLFAIVTTLSLRTAVSRFSSLDAMLTLYEVYNVLYVNMSTNIDIFDPSKS